METPKHPLWETATDYASRKTHELTSRGYSCSDARRMVNNELDRYKKMCGWG